MEPYINTTSISDVFQKPNTTLKKRREYCDFRKVMTCQAAKEAIIHAEHSIGSHSSKLQCNVIASVKRLINLVTGASANLQPDLLLLKNMSKVRADR